MPLKWKTSTVQHGGEKFEVTHWAKHDPRAILAAIHGKPDAVVGVHPRGKVFRFGPHTVIAREFAKTGQWEPPQNLWRTLQKLARNKAAIVEMPVALVQQKRQPPTIVTIWKKDSRPLDLLLSNPDVSIKRKEQACRSAVRRLGQLHAAGFRHGHIKSDNLVVDRAGNAKLIDYTLVSPLWQSRETGVSQGLLSRRFESDALINNLTRSLYPWPYPPEGTDDDRIKTSENTSRLGKELNEEYWKYFKKYKPPSLLSRLFRRR